MGARRPSARRNFHELGMDLNLTPMMNMVGILIPALLISMAFIEISTVDVTVAGDTAKADGPPPELDLTVFLTGQGIEVRSSEHEAQRIPLVTRMVSCIRYRGTWPPPRTLNRSKPPCDAGDSDRRFRVYDLARLTDTLKVLKDAHPTARAMTVMAEPDVSYEAVVDVMDASREAPNGKGSATLFDEVLFRPGVSL